MNATVKRNLAVIFILLTVETQIVISNSIAKSFDGVTYTWEYGRSAEKTYIFTNIHWWESIDHQMISIVSLLTLAKNTSSVAVIPPIPIPRSKNASTESLLGDYFNIEEVNDVQPVMTLARFMTTKDYDTLRNEMMGTVYLPKASQEEYEAKLKIYGKLRNTVVSLQMPAVDPENTKQKCNSFAGTMHLDSFGKVRYVFLDRIHFMHFCFEKFMPWWYDIRHKISPRQPYLDVVHHLVSDKQRPVSVIHISDLMDSQKQRASEEVERYARQIVDALRKNQAISGSMFLIYANGTTSVKKVVNLLTQEFDKIVDCSIDQFCDHRVSRDLFDTPLSKDEYKKLFTGPVGTKMMSWALGCRADVFIGNIHSPFSRNVCLHRKTHGKPYSIIRGFGELRKIWSWNLWDSNPTST